LERFADWAERKSFSKILEGRKPAGSFIANPAFFLSIRFESSAENKVRPDRGCFIPEKFS